MTVTRPNRISPFQRRLSALLAVLYLTVALGAVRHAGEHDESGLEWLPREFHHHVYELVQDDAGASLALHDFCVTCHFSSVRLGSSVPSFEVDSPRPSASLRAPIVAPRPAPLFDRTIRGPPA